jgi:hypothetical protein
MRNPLAILRMAREWCLSKEMRLLIVEYACSLRRPYVISEFLSVRSAVRASSREFTSLVDCHAPFWDRMLCTPRTPEDHVLDVVECAMSHRMDLVIRFMESDAADAVGVDEFMSRALPMLRLLFSLCQELTIEASSSQVTS